MKIGSKNRRVREIGGKLQCSTEEEKRLLVRVIGSLVHKIEGSRNWDFTLVSFM